jgi:hypothetical protein
MAVADLLQALYHGDGLRQAFRLMSVRLFLMQRDYGVLTVCSAHFAWTGGAKRTDAECRGEGVYC